MNPRLLAAAAALVLAPVLAPAQPASPGAAATVVPLIAFRERTLANGLKVYSAIDKATPNVSVQVWYGVGSKDDPQGRSGFAHLFEHMMFKATKDFPAETFDRLTEDVGGANNASTHDDFTEYHETVPADQLQRLLWAEAERMSALVVDQSNFTSEREVVKEELRQRVLAAPYGRLFALDLPEASFKAHPYKRPGIGSIADLDAATLQDVRAFHATYYRPDDASLIVVGNFDQAQLDAWVDRYFGPIVRPDRPIPRVTAVEPPRAGPGLYRAYGPNVPLPAVAVTWLAPARSSPDAPALLVLDAILSTGDSSRLYQSLVHDQQVAAEAFSEADLREQPGLMVAGAIAAGGKSLDQLQTALMAQIARVRDAPVTAAELRRAKNQLIAEALHDRETAEGKGQALGYAIALQHDAARANEEIQRLQAVTVQDVQRVARAYLPADSAMVIRYQADSAKPPGAPSGPAGGPSPPVAAPALEPPLGPPAKLLPPDERQAPPPVGAPVKAVLPTPVERTLSNGLKVIVAHSSALPLVTAQFTVRTGGAADPAGKAGTADLTATLLDKGAAGMSAEQIANAIESLGGSIQSGASWDGSQVTLDVLAANLPKALPILAKVVRQPTFAPDELERQRKQSLDELAVELQEPGAIARYVGSIAAFAGTPYGHVLGGSPQSLRRIARADVVALHRAYYRPDNAVLVLTGDITPEQGLALAKAAFGDWTAPKAPLPKPRPVRPQARPRVIVVDLPGAGQAAVGLAAPGIARSDPRFYAGIVANGVLGGGYSSWLNEEIRIKRGLSYGAGSALEARRFTGPFVARVQTKNQSAPEVAELMLAQVRRLRAAPASAEDVDAREAAITGAYGRNLETAEGLADTLSTYALLNVPLSEMQAYDDKVRAVTPQAAQSFADQVLDPSKADLVVVGDAKQFLPQLKAKYPDLQVIPAARLDLDSPTLESP
jgi:zinc protease